MRLIRIFSETIEVKKYFHNLFYKKKFVFNRRVGGESE